jgi:Domain of unknown function (DUF4232)
MDQIIRGRFRRLAVVLAGAVLLVAIGGFAVSVRSHPRQLHTDTAVPWADLPATRPVPPPPIKVGQRPPQPPCRAGDLEALWPDGGATISDPANGSDSTGVAILVRNIGAAPCTLSGYPEVQGIDRYGKPVGPPAEVGRYLPTLDPGAGPATLDPGEPGRVYLSMASNGCNGPKRDYNGANVVLENGFKFTIRNAWLSGRCPLKVTPWAPMSNEDRRFWGLEAHLITPPFASAGAELTYVLELINVTHATIGLMPCPVFTQALTVEEGFRLEKLDDMVHYTHRLNCEPHSTIGPKQVVRYEMKVLIPEGYPTGKTQLFWMAEESHSPFASASLNIT